MDYTFYSVRKNDQLFKIIRNHYGNAAFLQDKQQLTRLVVENNPAITNIDLIHPGQVIMLPDLSAGDRGGQPPIADPRDAKSCQITSNFITHLSEPTKSLMEQIDYFSLGKELGISYVNSIEKHASASRRELEAIVLNYYRKEAGTISRNQYNYRRRVKIASIEKKFGLLGQTVHPGKRPGQVFRVEGHAAMRTEKLLNSANMMDRVGKLAKNGLVVLKAVDYGNKALAIGTAETDQERTGLVVDFVSEGVGAAAGIALAAVVFGNPVGLTGLLVVAVASTAGSALGEVIGDKIEKETLYDDNGKRIETKLDRFWSIF